MALSLRWAGHHPRVPIIPTLQPVVPTDSSPKVHEMSKTESKPYAIGTLLKQPSVHIETIRSYEREGILPQPPRGLGGWGVSDEARSHCKNSCIGGPICGLNSL